MKGKAVSAIILTLLSRSMLNSAFNIQSVKASGTIYIRADGSIEPTTAPMKRNGDIYTLTGNIFNNSIEVERDNIVVDGASYILQGPGYSVYDPLYDSLGLGVRLTHVTNVTIRNAKIEAFGIGIYISYFSNHSIISRNDITNNGYGVYLVSPTQYSIISENKINNNQYGIRLSSSSNNTIYGNNITGNNYRGISIGHCSYNNIIENNIAKNKVGIETDDKSSYNNISGNNIENNGDIRSLSDNGGLYIEYSNNNRVDKNTIKNNSYGIFILNSANNTISENRVKNNVEGILLFNSFSNTLYGNTIAENRIYINGTVLPHGGCGVKISSSSNNTFYHNNFVENALQVYGVTVGSSNSWDNGVEGNFWSDYNGTDANEAGVGDTPCIIDEWNQDDFPLMRQWGLAEESPPPFWMQWWFWTIVVGVIAALAGTAYFLKKRKSPTPTYPALPIQNTKPNSYLHSL